jgi:hypothetical protein
MNNKNKNMNTPMCTVSFGIFTIACGSNSAPTVKCILRFPGCISSMPVTIVSEGTPYFLFSKKKKNIKGRL